MALHYMLLVRSFVSSSSSSVLKLQQLPTNSLHPPICFFSLSFIPLSLLVPILSLHAQPTSHELSQQQQAKLHDPTTA